MAGREGFFAFCGSKGCVKLEIVGAPTMRSMPLRETEAIVLRTYSVGEADKIVSLFTRDMGRLRAAASGARRVKSRWGALLEPLTYVRLWIYDRENRELLRLNSAELLESFFAIQGDQLIQVAAQYLAEAAGRFLPEREVNERAFRLWLAVLRGIKRGGQIGLPLLYFDYWLLRLSGFLPALDKCARCGRPFGSETAYCRAEPEGVFCRDCRPATAATPLSAAARGLAETARRTPLADWLASGTASAAATREARRLLETWVAARAEGKLVTLEQLREGA